MPRSRRHRPLELQLLILPEINSLRCLESWSRAVRSIIVQLRLRFGGQLEKHEMMSRF
jgi:hypothetical protein